MRDVRALSFATSSLEEECVLMRSLVECKMQPFSKYARAAPVLASKLILHEMGLANKLKLQLLQCVA